MDDHDPERKAGLSGLKPHAGWRLAAFCTEELDGSRRTRRIAGGILLGRDLSGAEDK